MAENSTAQEQPRWWSRAVQIGGVVAAVLLLLAALGTRFGIWQFGAGFMLMFGAIVLAAICFGGGLVGYFIARKNDLAVDKPPLLLGTLLGALILGVMGVQFNAAFSVPPIHNISTDTNDPPEFYAVGALRGTDSNPLEYDAAALAGPQTEAYPWVKPLVSELQPQAAFQRAQQVVADMGLEIVAADAARRVVEATHTSFWFGFKDDMVVRIRPAGDGSVIDVRSVSRVGQSDIGANARRIGAFLDAFAGSR